MAEIINQIPGFEKGTVHYVSATDEVDALFLAAQMVSDLLNKWNSNVAFFSCTGRSEGLINLVKNESSVARLHTVSQRNKALQVLLRKAAGIAHRRAVHYFIIEGLPPQDAIGKRWLLQFAKSTDASVTIIELNEEQGAAIARCVALELLAHR